MGFITNLLSLPFHILVWLIETYLLFVAMRLVMASSQTARQSQFYYQMKLLTDPLPNAVGRMFQKWTRATVSPWLPWLTVIFLACIVRQVLVSCVTI